MPTGSEYIHGLDAEAYRNKISRPHFSDQELEQKIYEKRSKVNAAGWAIGAGVASIFFTLGVSALTLPLPLVPRSQRRSKTGFPFLVLPNVPAWCLPPDVLQQPWPHGSHTTSQLLRSRVRRPSQWHRQSQQWYKG